MKIAIAGAGVAGSYLGCMLQKKGHEVEVFEASKKADHWSVCAWGGSKHMLSKFSQQAGLNFDDYILHNGKALRVFLPNDTDISFDLKGIVTYDKQRWEHDLLQDIKITYSTKCTPESFPLQQYDLILDCTGLHRTLLPKPKMDSIVPAYEYLVENIKGDNDFYTVEYKRAMGYFWYFPLDNGRAFVGAGDMGRKYYGIQEFFQQHPEAKIVKKIGRPIRIAPPHLMQPFYHQNIVGIGESIGCIFSLFGEGIIPALICSDIFLDVLSKNNTNRSLKKFDFDTYARTVLRKFDYYYDVFKVMMLKRQNKLSTFRHFGLLLNMYRNMKREELRLGIEINFNKWKKYLEAI